MSFSQRAGDLRLNLSIGIILVLAISAAHPATLTVDKNGTNKTVRAAYAAATNGDTIRIPADLFLETAGLFTPTKHVTFVAIAYKATVSVNTPPSNDNYTSPVVLSGASVVAYRKQLRGFDGRHRSPADPKKCLVEVDSARRLWFHCKYCRD